MRASKLFHSGEHPTLRLETREGFTLTGTHNHPVLCMLDVEGVPMLLWKLLSEVQPGDVVAIQRSQAPAPAEPTRRESDQALIAGALVAEGWFSEKRAGFNNTDKAYFDALIAAFDREIGGARYTSQRELASGKLIHELDIHNTGPLCESFFGTEVGRQSAEKRVPETIWRGSRAMKRAFLQALFEGDGSSSLLGRNTIQVSYSTRSPQLAADVQALLLEFGVLSRQSRSRRGELKVVMTSQRDCRLFAERVGFWGVKQHKLTDELDSLPPCRGLSKDAIPFLADYIRSEEDSHWLRRNNIDRIERWERDGAEIFDRIRSKEVRAVVLPLVEAGYYYAEVTAVTPAGVQPVYSLRVDTDDHTFLTDGFISHNTECKLAEIAIELLSELKQRTVDYRPNYDGQHFEPIVLPAQFPQLLVNGAEGIAVGMATRIPPHNLREVIDAATLLIDDPEATVSGAVQEDQGAGLPDGRRDPE